MARRHARRQVAHAAACGIATYNETRRRYGARRSVFLVNALATGNLKDVVFGTQVRYQQSARTLRCPRNRDMASVTRRYRVGTLRTRCTNRTAPRRRSTCCRSSRPPERSFHPPAPSAAASTGYHRMHRAPYPPPRAVHLVPSPRLFHGYSTVAQVTAHRWVLSVALVPMSACHVTPRAKRAFIRAAQTLEPARVPRSSY